MGRKRGRGNYPHDFKRQVVAETIVEGATVAEVGRRHGLNSNMVFQWRKDPRFAPDPSNLFLPVEVIPASPCNNERLAPTSASVEVVLGDGTRITAPAGADPEFVIRLVKGLSR